MYIEHPDTAEFKEFKRLVTENSLDSKNHAYDKFLVEEIIEKEKDVFGTDEYSNWVRCNLNHLKYIYFEEIMKNDYMGVIPLIAYCMKAYVVYMHNKKMEIFEDVKDEIENLVKP
jgi:hypothetical protein